MSGGGFSFLRHFMARKIAIDVSPERFVFDCDGTNVVLATYLFVGGDGRILGAGDSVAGEPGAIRIALFGTDYASIPTAKPVTEIEVLSAFLRNGIWLKMNRPKLLIRPSISIRGQDSLAAALQGRQVETLRQALPAAGAGSIDFG